VQHYPQIIKYFFLILLSTTLIGCSGGGSGGEQSTTTTVDGFTSNYFKIVNKPFDVMFDGVVTPEGGDPSYPGIMKIFDRNADGFDDILYISGSFRSGYTGNGQSYGVMNYWENSGAGAFVNRTAELFGGASMNVSTRKVRFHDINSDGFMDLLLANNKEDGRTHSGDSMDVSNIVYISKPDGSYNLFMVGVPAWTHHAEMFDIDYDGVIEVIDGNYTQGLRIYDLMPDGIWAETSSEYPNREDVFDANDTILADFNGDNCVDSISTRKHPDTTERTYHIGDCSGGFTFVEHYSIVSSVSTMPGRAWNGDLANFSIADIDGQLFAGIANFWSHAADYDNDGDIDILYAAETTKVTDEEIANNFYIEGGEVVTHLILLRNNAGTLEKMTALPGGLDNIGLYFARVVDVDGDSYPDLVIDDHHGWNNTANINDVIYYNKGDGTFVKNTVEIISGEISNSLKSTVPIDFNNDGIMDFVIRKPCTDNCLSESIMLLKGTKALPRP
jgi:hypothetical protein